MSNTQKLLTTLFFGAVSGLGFYSVSAPATRLSTFAVGYFFPASENYGRTVPADSFEDRWYPSARGGDYQIGAALCSWA
jgi:hypothetical protein